MSELQSTTISEVANSNNAASPNGMPEGCAPSTVNDVWRENVAAQVREFNRLHGLDNSRALLSTGGTNTAYTLTYTTAPASLFTGLICGFKVNATCGASPTLNVNGLGAIGIQKMTATGFTDLVAGDLVATQHVWVKYDGTLAKFVMMSPIAAAFSDPMQARGDIMYRNSVNATTRLALGTANKVLGSDGTDLSWRTIGQTLEGLGTTQGEFPIRGTVAWGTLPVGTSGQFLKTNGAGANPAWVNLTSHAAPAKAWCTFDGTVTGTNAPTDGFNVTSVTRNSTGDYTITFTTAMADTNYGIVVSCTTATANAAMGGRKSGGTKTTAAVEVLLVQNGANAAIDKADVTVVIYSSASAP